MYNTLKVKNKIHFINVKMSVFLSEMLLAKSMTFTFTKCFLANLVCFYKKCFISLVFYKINIYKICFITLVFCIKLIYK